MKIVYILHDTDEFGGANKSFMSLLRGLMKKGVEPLIVLPNNRGLTRKLNEEGIPTLVLNYRLNTYPYEESLKDFLLWIPRLIARRYLNAKAARQLAGHIDGYNLVHTNVSVIDIGERAAKAKGIPHVFHFREYADLDFSMKYFPCKRSFCKTVKHSICITKGVQGHHHLSENSRVIYDTVIDERVKSLVTLSDNEQYLLYAGRLEETKGIEDLLKAYANSRKLLPLWVAGAPSEDLYLDKLKQKAQQYNIENKVRFLGARNDVMELMAGAHATIVPSFNEGFGRILPEAMLAGCLTIGRNTGGTKEQYDNGLELTGGEIGLRFNTMEELTDLIDKACMTERTEWSSYIERAYKTVNTLYTQEACSNATMDFYHSIIQ